MAKKLDGRRSNGGARANCGRKKTVEILGVAALIDEEIGEEGKRQLIRKLFDEAMNGSFPHIQLLCYYRFGKPTEKVIIEGNNDQTNYTPIVNVITTQERYNKLMKDIGDSESVEQIYQQRMAAVEEIIKDGTLDYRIKS